MRIEDLDYCLPPDRVAQQPAPARDLSRLMLVDARTGASSHHVFIDLPGLLAPRSVIVVNDTRVMPARIACARSTGAKAEVLLVRRLGLEGSLERWSALVRAGGRARPGLRLVAEGLAISLVSQIEGPLFEVELEAPGGSVQEEVRRHGKVPLPPYIRREALPLDRERYQTVYADEEGSAAAPTAGLHFTKELIETLAASGHDIVRVTLHVGPGTFMPVRSARVEDHRMHEEWVRVTQSAAATIREAKSAGRRIVAVGTTVVRTLEGVAALDGELGAHEGPVDIFIKPGHRFLVVDELITNFHLPRSTLLALVMALSDRDKILAAYACAIDEGYRFYSYGDAMFLCGSRS